MKSLHLYIFLCLLLAVCPSARLVAQTQDDGTVFPVYIQLVDFEPSAAEMKMSDEDFYRTAGSVIFPVNKYTLNRQSALVQQLERDVLPRAKREEWTLVGLSMRGAASPEGPLRWNTTLAHRRRQAILDYLQEHLTIREEMMQEEEMPEDYPYLVLLMREKGDPDAWRVAEVVEENRGSFERMKDFLQHMDKGALWRRLLREYYPQLRAARIVLWFKGPKQAPALMLRAVEETFESQPLELFTTVPHFEAPQMDALTLLGEPARIERRHMMAVRTNLLYDAFYLPHFGWGPMWDVSLEFYPRRGHLTYGLEFTSPYYHRWSKHKFFQIRDYHVEARYYFRPGWNHTRGYLGVYANVNKYGIGFSKTKGWQGEGGGGGLQAGYVWKISRSGRWRMECHVAAGAYVTRYDPYVYGNPRTGVEDGDYYYDYLGYSSDFKKRQYRRVWFGPTSVGLSLTYDVLYWRHQKKGVGVKRWERRLK